MECKEQSKSISGLYYRAVLVVEVHGNIPAVFLMFLDGSYSAWQLADEAPPPLLKLKK